MPYGEGRRNCQLESAVSSSSRQLSFLNPEPFLPSSRLGCEKINSCLITFQVQGSCFKGAYFVAGGLGDSPFLFKRFLTMKGNWNPFLPIATKSESLQSPVAIGQA